MSELKCPFCQQELEKRHAATTDYNSMFITYYCGNPECESTTDLTGCKEFWDILGQLIRTRKALEIAINAMKSAGTHNSINCLARGEDPSKDDVGITINCALDQIKQITEIKDK